MDSALHSRFSRQILLPEMGLEGQKRIADSRVLLAGGGPAAEACSTALRRAGVEKMVSWDGTTAPQVSGDKPTLILVVTEDGSLRRTSSRLARKNRIPTLFYWPFTEGFSLARFSHQDGCACLECFESSNPKMFLGGNGSFDLVGGAQAASEAILGLLMPSPLENGVWTVFDSGPSHHHWVTPSSRCPAAVEKP